MPYCHRGRAHSAWISRLLRSWGHEVIVANPRRVLLIAESSRKNDKLDARMLARLARIVTGRHESHVGCHVAVETKSPWEPGPDLPNYGQSGVRSEVREKLSPASCGWFSCVILQQSI